MRTAVYISIIYAVLCLGGTAHAAYFSCPALGGAVTSVEGNCTTSLNPSTSGAAPTIQRFTSGSGATYTTPAAATVLIVTECGGGGGGGGIGGTTGPAGGTGGTTTFNSVTAIGGTGGNGTTGTTGGTKGGGGQGGTGTTVARYTGGDGTDGANVVAALAQSQGGMGGISYLGGWQATATSANGAGAPGFTSTAVTLAGSGGGGAGECAVIRISSPSATYTYTVGGGGAGGIGTGTSAQTGPAGNGGSVQVQEYYAATVGIAPVTASGLSAAGTTLGGATALTSQWNTISTVGVPSGSIPRGVSMPSPVVGLQYMVFNAGANILNVWPSASGVQINALGNGNAIALAVGAALFVSCPTTTQCYAK